MHYIIALQSIPDISILLHPLQIFFFYIFMKKLYLWLFDLRRSAEQSDARKFYDISAKK